MKANVGGIDRIVRIVIGAVILAWGAYAQNWWGLVGAVPLLTGLMSWCPPYNVLGISSCAVKSK